MSAQLDVAIFDLLRTDPTLQLLAPGGIYRDAAPEGVVESAQDDPAEVFGTVTVRRALVHHTFCSAPIAGPVPPIEPPEPEGPPLSAPSFAVQGTPTTNDLSDDGYTFALAAPLLMDAHGDLILWAERHRGNNARLRPVVSHDGGATWVDPTISGFFDGDGEGFLTRCACAWDSIHDQLHCLWVAVDATDGFIYRRYALTRDGANHIVAVTKVPGVNLQLDLATGVPRYLGHPNLLWQPLGAHGHLLAVWSIQNDAGSPPPGSEVRASMRVLSNTTDDGIAANWVAPVTPATDTISNPPQVAYSLLASRTGYGGVPFVGIVRKATGSHVGDVYVGGYDGNQSASGGTWAVRRMIWNSAASNWSNGLGPVVALDTVTLAGTDAGYPQKRELLTQLTEDPIHDRIFAGYPVWLDDAAGDSQVVRYVDAADTVSARVVLASAGGAHAFAPTLDAVCDPTTGTVAVVYQKTDTFLYTQVVDGTTVVQAETPVFSGAPVDIPLLWSGGRTAADKLLVAFRNHTPGGPPYVGYFGSLTWAAAPAARVAPRIVTSAVPPLDEVTYLVQFVSPSSNPQGAQAALDRALALLPGLTVPAYHVACSRPRERLPFVVIDGPIRWETRAALWEVWAEAAGGAP